MGLGLVLVFSFFFIGLFFILGILKVVLVLEGWYGVDMV